jgi:hypothetical protein
VNFETRYMAARFHSEPQAFEAMCDAQERWVRWCHETGRALADMLGQDLGPCECEAYRIVIAFDRDRLIAERQD